MVRNAKNPNFKVRLAILERRHVSVLNVKIDLQAGFRPIASAPWLFFFTQANACYYTIILSLFSDVLVQDRKSLEEPV